MAFRRIFSTIHALLPQSDFASFFGWENPHTHIIVKVDPGAADSSTVGTWDIEGGSTNIMGRQGWTRATFKAGDHVKLVAHPMKDGTKGASLFYAHLPDGKRLYHDIARPKTEGLRAIIAPQAG